MRRFPHTALAIIVIGLASVAVRAETAMPQKASLQQGFALAKTGMLTEPVRLALNKNPLLPWLEAINLKQQFGTAESAQIQAIVKNNLDEPSSIWLIGQWRNELIRRQDWQNAAAWNRLYPDESVATRCAVLLSVEVPARDQAWRQNALAIWVNESKPPSHCSMLFDGLKQLNALGNAEAWQRFERLLGDDVSERFSEPMSVMSLDAAVLAKQYVDFLSAPQMPASVWPNDARTKTVLSKGLLKLAKKNPDQAELLLSQLVKRYALSTEQNATVLSEIALWTMVEYDPQAERRFFAVPEKLRSANLREWYMRFKFQQNDNGKIGRAHV